MYIHTYVCRYALIESDQSNQWVILGDTQDNTVVRSNNGNGCSIAVDCHYSTALALFDNLHCCFAVLCRWHLLLLGPSQHQIRPHTSTKESIRCGRKVEAISVSWHARSIKASNSINAHLAHVQRVAKISFNSIPLKGERKWLNNTYHLSVGIICMQWLSEI